MHIRKAVEDEAPLLSFLSMESTAYWGYTVEDMLNWKPYLTVPREAIAAFPFYVAEVDQTVVGYYNLIPGDRLSLLYKLFVVPARIRQGIGRALMHHAVEVASAMGSRQMAIDAEPHAEAFYTLLGARRVDAVAAPSHRNPERVRPQLILDLPEPDTGALTA